jgi:hypothetical protein
MVAATIIVTFGMVGAFAAPASAGAGLPACGVICNYHDPQTYQVWIQHQDPDGYYYCASDAVTVRSGVYLELRYSPHCETTWARLKSNFSLAYVQMTISSSSGASSSAEGIGMWTVMLNDHGLLNHACLSYMNGDGGPVYQDCTTSY